MSHLQHINDYKKVLIEKGIVDHKAQIALVRTAYVTAFIRFFQAKGIKQEDRKDIMFYLLSYWNETFPVNGNMVISLVTSFYTRLNQSLVDMKGNFYVNLVDDQYTTTYPEYNDPTEYCQLVDTLMGEINMKYSHISVK